ncbi:hypothetical protein SG0636 [Sodalis glossinidius str. 'morsitans']|uniref:Uncharacterized protein n=1 Tax=Sodalis glossinidius (strain morsitans) TaxID=343509 RepID=Q2NVB4_SODGM|nr:helix-turn-helix domain-containing protein [Sodalis glossinidius]BAE73911.1 hypothetical protein SG0636 [Sodalis glossinidius str. 'morsitans']
MSLWVPTEGLSFSDMARRLPLPKSTLSRLLVAMESQGLLARDPHSRLYSIGHLVRSLNPPVPLHQLSARYRCTGYLCVLHQDRVHIVDRFQSSAAAPAVYAVGRHLPAMNTAAGRALLACFSEREVIARLMPRQNLPGGFHQPGIVRLLQRMSLVRGQGWDFNRNDTRPGYSVLATALADSERREQIGLCLSFVNAGDKGAFPVDKLAGLQSATRMIAQNMHQ